MLDKWPSPAKLPETCALKVSALDQVNQVRILEGQLTAELTARDPLKATQGVVMIRKRSIACPIRSIWRCSGICVGGKRPNLLSRHYRGWPHFRLHSPRAERIREKSPVTPSARSVQTKRSEEHTSELQSPIDI